MRRAKRGEGKIFNDVFDMLDKAGYKPSCLTVVTGYWLRCDCFRWEVHLKIKGFMQPCGCWYNMTEFLKLAKKKGFHITDNEIWPN